MNVSIATLLRAINVKLRSVRPSGVTFGVNPVANRADQISNLIADVSGMLHGANLDNLTIEIDQIPTNPFGAHNIKHGTLIAAGPANSDNVRVGIFRREHTYDPFVVASYRDGDSEWSHGSYCRGLSEALLKFVDKMDMYL